MSESHDPVDDQLAEDVLGALTGYECQHGGGRLDPRTGHCGDDTHTHCRWFCGESYCAHLLFSWTDDGTYDGPEVPLPPQWLGLVDEWPDAWKEVAFGEFPQLVTYYAEIEEGRLRESTAFDIVESLASQGDVPTHHDGWGGEWMGDGVGVNFYAKDPGRAYTELEAQLDGLRERFQQLARSQSGIDDLQAEEALAILADLECPHCRAAVVGPRPWFCSDCRTAVCLTCFEISNTPPCDHLLPTEGRPSGDHRSCVACGQALQGWRCRGCLSVHCPFCGVRSSAWRGSSWTLGDTRCQHLIASWCDSSGEWQMMPVSDEDIGFERLTQIAVSDYAVHAVQAVFGDLADLAALVEAEQATPSPGVLDTMIEHARLSAVVDVWWDDENGMGSDTGHDYFAPDTTSVGQSLRTLIDRLVDCQERLDVAEGGPTADD